jgi:hypothetical protein
MHGIELEGMSAYEYALGHVTRTKERGHVIIALRPDPDGVELPGDQQPIRVAQARLWKLIRQRNIPCYRYGAHVVGFGNGSKIILVSEQTIDSVRGYTARVFMLPKDTCDALRNLAITATLTTPDSVVVWY